jgi:hypothetical protein
LHNACANTNCTSNLEDSHAARFRAMDARFYIVSHGRPAKPFALSFCSCAAGVDAFSYNLSFKFGEYTDVCTENQIRE